MNQENVYGQQYIACLNHFNSWKNQDSAFYDKNLLIMTTKL